MRDRMRRGLLLVCAMIAMAVSISGMAVSAGAVTYDYSSVVTDDGNWRVWIKKATSTTAAECAIKPAKAGVAGVSKGAVTIPATITYKKTKYAVTNIVSAAWQGNTAVTSVNFKNATKLVSIRQNAFKGCKNLMYLYYFSTIPLTAVGDSAFEGDNSLEGNIKAESSLVLPKTIKTIGKNAFKGIFATEVDLSKATALTTVGDGAFALFEDTGDECIYVYNASKVSLLNGKTSARIIAVNCVINYRSNDGKNTTKTQNASINADSITLNASNTFSRTGYSFSSWNTKTDGKGKKYSAGTKISGTDLPDSGVFNLYAVWSPIAYNVKFDKNAPVNVNTNQAYSVTGTMANVSCKYDQTVSVPSNKYACAGFTMAGWYTNKNGTGSKVTSIKNMRSTPGDVILYAKWTPVSYKVKYNANGGTGSMAVQSMNYNAKYTLTANAFTRTGYKFGGWAVSAAGAKKFVDKASVQNLTTTSGAEYNLYAVWQPIKYTVYFRTPTVYRDREKYEFVDVHTGSVETISNAEYNRHYNVPTSHYDVEGYEFKGWLYNGKPVTDIYNLTTTDGAYVSLEQEMSPVKYTVRFDANGGKVKEGSSGYSDVVMTYSESYRRYDGSVYENPGYTFAGWSTSPAGKVEYLAGDRLINLTSKPETVTLYAVWEPLSYKIKFNANVADESIISGSQPDLVCEYGKTYRLGLCDMINPGYKLKSWNTKADGSGTVYEENAQIQNLTDKEETINLYAQWEPITYVLKFSTNTGSGTAPEDVIVTYGKEWTIPKHSEEKLYKTGYRFAGWCTNRRGVKDPTVDRLFVEGQAYTENLTTTEDEEITLYAIWKPAKYKVHFVTGTDEQMADKEFAYNGSGIALDEADSDKKPGYEFSSWNTKKDGTGIQLGDSLSAASNKDVLDTAVVDENDEYTCVITLYAQWSPRSYTIGLSLETKEGAAVLPDDQPPIEVLYGSRYADKLPIPVLEHYDFQYWAKADGTPITAETVYDDPAVDGIELHPVWKIKEYTVVYNYMGASDRATGKTEIQKKYKYGAALSDMPGASDIILSSEQKGCHAEFFYWALDGKGAQKVSRSYKVERDMTLYAYIDVRTYNVTFDFNGGKLGSARQKVLIYNGGTQLGANSDYKILGTRLTKNGYTFGGWYYNEAGQKHSVRDTYAVNKDITLYADWTKDDDGDGKGNNSANNIVSVKFDFNGGTASGSKNKTIRVRRNSTLKNSKSYKEIVNKINRSGYTFAGWSNTPNGRVTSLGRVQSDMTLYAVWTKNSGNESEIKPDTYKITLNYNGASYGKKKSSIITYTKSDRLGSAELFNKISSNIKRQGYRFGYWYYKQGKNVVKVTGKYSVTSNKEIYIKWVKQYKVKVNLNGGKYAGKKQMTITYDAKKKIGSDNQFSRFGKKAVRSGYVFDGWYYKNGNRKVTVRNTTFVNKNMTIYASWRKPEVIKKASTLNKTKKKVVVSWKNDDAFYAFQYRYSTKPAGLNKAKVYTQKMVTKKVNGRKQTVLPNSINVAFKNPYILVQVRGLYKDSTGRKRKTAWRTFYDVDNVRSTVTFDAKGGRIVIGKKKLKTVKVTFIKGKALQTSSNFTDGKLYKPVRKGYIFKGWYYKKSGKMIRVKLGTRLAPGTKVTARWARK